MWRILAAAVCLATLPAATSPRDAAFAELREQDQRIADIAHRLAVRGVPHCPGRLAPQSGIRIHAIEQYDAKDRRAAADYFGFGLGLLPNVLAVAESSPAKSAGILPDDAIVSVDGVNVRGSDYAAVERARTALATGLADGVARITLARRGKKVVEALAAEPGCLSEVELIPARKLNASADGRIVQVTTAVLAETADDAELAFVIAHEMAHNILGHRAQLDRKGRSARKIRETEVEADRLAIKLMIAAGYDPRAAARFWSRFGKKTGAGIFSDGTHLRTKARVELLEQLASQFSAQ